jgi:para-nitrobenzyl esterase
MSAYWVHFAATGDPNGEGLPPWPVYQAATDEYIELGDAVKAAKGLYKDACDLWDKAQATKRPTTDKAAPAQPGI